MTQTWEGELHPYLRYTSRLEKTYFEIGLEFHKLNILEEPNPFIDNKYDNPIKTIVHIYAKDLFTRELNS